MDGLPKRRLGIAKEMAYPKLSQSGYEITSRETAIYNCIAWSIKPGDERNWWPWDENYYWPPEAPREETVEAFVKTYELYGFEVCVDGTLEAGFEKVVLYVDRTDGAMMPTHAARQLPDGMWTSKLGGWEDISHQTLSALEGEDPAYGEAAVFFKRKVTNQH